MLVALAAAMPFAAGGGCGRTACFAFSAEAYAKNGMACPAQADALPNFTDSQCPGPVVSVDGAGSFDGELCCYPVTEEDIQPNCGQGASQSTGVGFGASGVGGFGVSGVGGGSSFGVSTASAGGGPPPSCKSSCAEAITRGGEPCATGLGPYQALQQCAGCNATATPCFAPCGSFCHEAALDPMCSACLAANCAAELTHCEND
jgi:hypothetical protein